MVYRYLIMHQFTDKLCLWIMYIWYLYSAKAEFPTSFQWLQSTGKISFIFSNPLYSYFKKLFFKCFVFFDRKYLLVDPTDKEEKVMDGKMVIGMNKHREICTLQVSGEMLLMKDQVEIC